MIEIPFIPETAPFSVEQRLWLNGYLAGYFARLNLPGHSPGDQTANAPRAGLVILFGSQTGTAEALARRLGKTAANHGFEPRVIDAAQHATIDWKSETTLFVVTSTYGEGEMPDNAQGFWTWLQSDAGRSLAHLGFSVLALGDSNYPEFCAAGKKIDARLSEIGAHRIFSRADCDVDYEAATKTWFEGALEAARSARQDGMTSSDPVHGVVNGSGRGQAIVSAGSAAGARSNGCASVFSRNNPFSARMLKNVCLSKGGSAKEVRHYELDLSGSDLRYEAGDALGVTPVNCELMVADLLEALHCTGEETVPIPEVKVSLREALMSHFDISKPSRDLLTAVADRVPGSELPALLAADRSVELQKWLWGRSVIDLLSLLREPFSAIEFVKLLKKLTPRLYSISSSQKVHPGEVHLTVSAVRYEAHGRARKGVASTFLADRVNGADCVKVFVQPSPGFKLPKDGETAAIMVGPGTGIAPFRAFLEERQAEGARGKNWLFFGDQKRSTDFLYEEQITGWLEQGHLARLDLAFSRDQVEKIYVQHRLLQRAGEVWSWLQEGAHFYVCGDASKMAKDVDWALHSIAECAGGLSAEGAMEFVKTLKDQKRYHRDVY